jgi:hypothetical protein
MANRRNPAANSVTPNRKQGYTELFNSVLPKWRVGLLLAVLLRSWLPPLLPAAATTVAIREAST